MTRGVGKVRHSDGKLLWIQTRKDFKMIQVPTDGSVANINAKALGGQRSVNLLNLICFWHSEDQIRVGEYERREHEEKRKLAVMIIVINIVGFSTLSFVTYKIYKHFEFPRADFAPTNRFMTGFYDMIIARGERRIEEFKLTLGEKYDELWGHVERRYNDTWQYSDWRSNGMEYRITELESSIREVEKDIREIERREERIDQLRSYARRIHCGLILNGGFTEHETPNVPTIIAYDVLQGLNAGNFLSRRSLEDMQASTGQYWGHRVMLKAATDGATPSEGPLNRVFKIGNREI